MSSSEMFTENFSILDDEKNNDKEKVSLSHAEFSEDTCNLMKKENSVHPGLRATCLSNL